MSTTGQSLVHVVVGAGQAGAYAAFAMRRAGFSGRILVVGDELQYPYDRTPLSKAMMTGAIGSDLTYFFEPQSYRTEAIDLRLGAFAEAIDVAAGRIHVAGLGPVPYDRLVLATGSRANGLDVPGGERIHKIRTATDARTLRRELGPDRRVVCIGAGVIGLELASAARAGGGEVTVVEIGQSVMARSLAPEIGAHVAARHLRAGVKILFGRQVVAIEDDAVVLDTGERLPADIVVAGIGVRRNVELAAGAGIVTDRGILVDGTGNTNVSGIYAAGDVAEFFSARSGGYVALESWRHAQEHGTHVGRSTVGAQDLYDEVPWFWSDQHGDNIQVAGTARGGARMLFRGRPDQNAFSVFFLDDRNRVIGAFGLNAGRDVSAAIRLIRKGGSVDPDVVADTSVTLQRLVAAASATADMR